MPYRLSLICQPLLLTSTAIHNHYLFHLIVHFTVSVYVVFHMGEIFFHIYDFCIFLTTLGNLVRALGKQTLGEISILEVCWTALGISTHVAIREQDWAGECPQLQGSHSKVLSSFYRESLS